MATTALWRSQSAPSKNATSHDAALLDAIKRSERLAHWCGRYTPWTSLDDDGGIWLDITGCQHLFGGEQALMQDLCARIAEQDLDVRAAVADTPGAAWAAARFGQTQPPSPSLSPMPGEKDFVGTFVTIPSGAQREMLASLPTAALRVGYGAAEGMRRLGVRRIGDLYALPRAPLAARFGADVLKRLDQALGHRDEPVSPIRPAPSRRVRITFPDPIGLRDDLWAAFERLLTALIERLETAGDGVRLLDLTGYRADGTWGRLVVGIGQASRDGVHIRRLVEEKFDGLDPGFGVEVMILAALETEAMQPAQHTLSGADAKTEDLARLVDRLQNRLGGERIGALVPTPRHMPERAQRAVPTLTEASGQHDAEGIETQAPTLPRPLHVLGTPEPIDAMAPVPDGPPVLFKWRRQTHRIIRADGPERIAPEWWLEDPAQLASGQARVRDYYQVEDDTGARYWLFRAGLYQSDKSPRWYLHGLFP